MLDTLKALVVSGYNQQQAMQRAVMARAQGLDPEKYGAVYPGSTVTNTTTNHNSGNGILKGALLSAAMLATGGAGTFGVVKMLTPTAAVVSPATKEPPAGKANHYDAITEELQPDGTWKQIKRERLK